MSSSATPLYGVVLAGGRGSRFWPWSRDAVPKQLLSLAGGPTLLETTARRMLRLVPPECLLVITREDLREAVVRVLTFLPSSNVVGEPEPRDTLAAVILSAALAQAISGRDDAVTVVASCDHLIAGHAAFLRNVQSAVRLAAGTSRLVAIGVRPGWPETGYGYIRPGRRIRWPGEASAREIEAFIEKPDRSRAERLIAGGCLWNAGIFAWRADSLLAAAARHVARAEGAIGRLRAAAAGPGGIAREAISQAYGELPKVSVDRAILEREPAIAVVEAEFGWLDLGTWNGAALAGPRDGSGNTVSGPVIAAGSRNNVVHAQPGKPVVIAGVDGLVVVDMPDVLLVTNRSQDQQVREIRELVRQSGWGRLL